MNSSFPDKLKDSLSKEAGRQAGGLMKSCGVLVEKHN